MVHILIPELYHKNQSQFLSQDAQRIFYQDGLHPAVQALDIARSAEWPATYNDEMFQARGTNSQLSFQTKVFPDWLVPYLGDAIREALQE